MTQQKKRGAAQWKASQDGNGAKRGPSERPETLNARLHSVGLFNAEALPLPGKEKPKNAGALGAPPQAAAAAGRTLGIASEGNLTATNAFDQCMEEEEWLRKWSKQIAEPQAAWLEKTSTAADQAVDLLKTGPFMLDTLAAAAAAMPTEREIGDAAEHCQPRPRARRKHAQIAGLAICLRAIERREEMAFERALIIFGRDISLYGFNAVSLTFIRERAQGAFPAEALCMRAIASATERWDRGLAQVKKHKESGRGWGADADYMGYQAAFWALDSVEPFEGRAPGLMGGPAMAPAAAPFPAIERGPSVAEAALGWAIQQGAPGATAKFWTGMGLHERSRWAGFEGLVQKAIENAAGASGARHETAKKAWEQRAFGLAAHLWREAGELGPDIRKDRVFRASFWASAKGFVQGRAGAGQKGLGAGPQGEEKNARAEIIRAAARAMGMFPVDEPARKVEHWVSENGESGPLFFAMMESEKIKQTVDAAQASQGASAPEDSMEKNGRQGPGASPRASRRPRSL